MRRLRQLAKLALGAWWVWQLLELALEWSRRPSPARIPDNGYPNEWGVRLTPLEPAELELALIEEQAIARRLAEHVG